MVGPIRNQTIPKNSFPHSLFSIGFQRCKKREQLHLSPLMDRPIFLQKKMILSKTHVDPSPNFSKSEEQGRTGATPSAPSA